MDKETILDYATNTPENTNRNVLGSMVDSLLRENSGAGLPEVTSEDNGDVLTVVEGAWAKAEPQGGEDITLYAISEHYEPEEDPTLPTLQGGQEWTSLTPVYWLASVPNPTSESDLLFYSQMEQLLSQNKRICIVYFDGVTLLYPTSKVRYINLESTDKTIVLYLGCGYDDNGSTVPINFGVAATLAK